MPDLIIENGLVIDGSGSPGFYSAVIVDGDTVILHRGDASGIEAGRRIDASDHVVCPGFVDVHSHAGLTILGEPHHDPKGPAGRDDGACRDRRHLPRAVQDRRGAAPVHLAGLRPQRLPARTRRLAHGRGPAGPLRQHRGHQHRVHPGQRAGPHLGRRLERQASDCTAEMEDMKAVVREAMEEGAWGLSTGLDYPPGSYASTEEVDRALRSGGRARRLLPHAHQGVAEVAGRGRAVGGGGGDRASQRHTRAPDALQAVGAGRRQPPRLHRPGRETRGPRAWTSRSTATRTRTPARR